MLRMVAPVPVPAAFTPLVQQLGRGLSSLGQCSCWRLSWTSFGVFFFFFSVLALPRPLCGTILFAPIPKSPLPAPLPRPAHQVIPVWAELPQAGIPDIPDLQLCPSPHPFLKTVSERHPVFPLLVPSLVFLLLCLLSARSNYLGLLDEKHSVLKRCFKARILGAHHQESTMAMSSPIMGSGALRTTSVASLIKG